MGMPTTAIQRLDLTLSYGEFNTRANRRNFIGLQVLPAIGVAMQSANFMKVQVASLLTKVEETKRAPKAGYSRGDFEWTTDSYATEDHGVEEIVDDRTIRMYGNEMRAERIHAERAVNRVLQRLEYDIATAVFNTTTWTGATLTTAVSTPWTTPAAATPIGDIDAALDKVKATLGMRGNTLILSDYALLKLTRTSQILDVIKYSGRDDPKVVMPALLDLFQIDRILVGRGRKNTADKGQTGAFAGIWDETMAMAAYLDPNSMDLEDMMPTIGRTIMWTDENAGIPGAGSVEAPLIVEEYREEGRRGGVMRARMDRQVKVLHAEAGHLLTAVTA